MNKRVYYSFSILLFIGTNLFAAPKSDSIDKLEKEYLAKKQYELEQQKTILAGNKKTLKKKLKRLLLNYKRKHKLSRVKKINKLLLKLKKGTLDNALNGKEEKEVMTTAIPVLPKIEFPKPNNNVKKIPRIKTKEDLVRMLKKCNPTFFGEYNINTEKGSITRVSFRNCGLVDIRPLANIKSLKQINLTGNPISDISCLKRLRKLKSINLDWTFVSDISALKNAPLTSASFAFSPVNDISPLGRKLTYLSLQGCLFVKALAPISKMKELRELILPLHFPYFKITFIKRLKQLKILDTQWRNQKEKTATSKFLKDNQGKIE